ncbi:50S ribosomal protein L21 [Candidatus Azambacteria bacterium RIFCSPHIGHO2_01_FULL_44_55]|uniref:Large ribosomal subunit protein bL21 n=1 Tax=Candidatus Azambacteria bacterium RIFCSPLOWO2_02_FULL_44_14 TaxID=1797306 RepID=A0A1F5C9T3_9BACT|nr:MAG: 50S ribosomal protein L21 [Candidatus Azambacteria bacterium RIFCSPLOWO2_01_FULL_44_84]OGD33147.1 MAG: 50S ribosomal protein L21 [Candidatus Azambacteria bacterium RIFCSPHIGHO2_02_FULL_45_18]OGD39608.1 MAG: 50S ribosomal protein L21 [Candidatus Azambacteria bacterium RIFCSPLOWO2_02_FULL_44_14]OGD39933.1 MAG: 50S ribosomal protein L21 [Candidatus Azambacteria bacterium RIFCSPHIGHO2_01_FULL_44_55]
MKIAVIKTGGKQYIVKEGDKLRLEKIDAKEGDEIRFSEVLLVGDEKDIKIGSPFVSDAKVTGKALKQGRAKKIIVFHYHSKTRYKKKAGHRQPYTEVEITEIK